MSFKKKKTQDFIEEKKQSFILIHTQDLHSKRTMDEFVSEIKKQDFIGVSGRSYFPFKIVDC